MEKLTREQLEKLIDKFNEHEDNCQCSLHVNNGRVNGVDQSEVKRMLLQPDTGYVYLMSLIAKILSEDMKACAAFNTSYHQFIQDKIREN